MKINNFKVQINDDTIIYSADFIFAHQFGSLNEQRLFRILKYLQPIINPLNFLKNGFTLKYTIYYKIPKKFSNKVIDYDHFFIPALTLSSTLKEDLYFEGSISKDTSKKIPQIIKYLGFKQQFKVLYKSTSKKISPVKKIGQFFTLGVESFYTLLCYKHQKNQASKYLIYIDGFDIPLSKINFLKKVHDKIDKVAQKTHTQPIILETNLKQLSDKILNWGKFHVAALSSVSLLLSFKKIYINGETFNYPDWGLRFGADKLFSTRSTTFKIINHNVRRDITIKRLLNSSDSQLFLENLRTCWQNVKQKKIAYNCSSCQKCLRTQITLLALGINNPPTFKTLNHDLLKKISLNFHIYNEWKILPSLLKKQPNIDPALLKYIDELLQKPITPP